jgi:hypothetical protein
MTNLEEALKRQTTEGHDGDCPCVDCDQIRGPYYFTENALKKVHTDDGGDGVWAFEWDVAGEVGALMGSKRVDLFGNLAGNYEVLERLRCRGVISADYSDTHTDVDQLFIICGPERAEGLEFLTRLNKYLKDKEMKLREAYDF